MKGSKSMMHSMQDGMKKMKSMKMTGDADKVFAMMMKMHIQQALDIAQVEIAQGKPPETTKMAKKIVLAQKKGNCQGGELVIKTTVILNYS